MLSCISVCVADIEIQFIHSDFQIRFSSLRVNETICIYKRITLQHNRFVQIGVKEKLVNAESNIADGGGEDHIGISTVTFFCLYAAERNRTNVVVSFLLCFFIEWRRHFVTQPATN